jgi:5'-nucleotidase
VRVLVTNDDGVDSGGIRVLADVAHALGLDVVVAAPSWNSSGASASLTGVSSNGRLLVESRYFDDLPNVPVFAVEAAPAMIVRVGILGGFGQCPDLVISGINEGANTGHAVLHSGTVGAALTAMSHGCRAIAFSAAGPKRNYAIGADIARRVILWALEIPPPFALNVNVPSGSANTARGLRLARLASFGGVETQVTEVQQGFVGVRFTEIDLQGEPDSDAALLAAGYATITALSPVCEASTFDVADLLQTFDAAPDP